MAFRSLITLLAAAGIAAATDGGSNSFHWTGHLEPGQLIEIKGINGGIRAEGTTGQEVEVIAEKSGRRYDPADVQIAIVDNPNGMTICAVYPSKRGSLSEPSKRGSLGEPGKRGSLSEPGKRGTLNDCRPGGGRMSTGNNDVKVEFTVLVPSGVRFTGRTVNGGVQAVHLRADVEAHTVNGKIVVSTSGTAAAHTINGSIQASLGSCQWEGARRFSTVNGSIDVELPGDINADLAANTVNGHINTDFPITTRGRFMSRSVHGTLGTVIGGAGGRELRLSTVNGSITLRDIRALTI